MTDVKGDVKKAPQGAQAQVPWIVNAIQCGQVVLSISPNVFRGGYRSFRSVCIGRRGPGVAEPGPWVYYTPSGGLLSFFVPSNKENEKNKDNEKDFEAIYKRIRSELAETVEGDDVGLVSDSPPGQTTLQTVKPEHKNDLCEFLAKEQKRNSEIESLLAALQALNVNVEDVSYPPSVRPPPEWFTQTQVYTYTDRYFSLAADKASRIWQLLAQHNLIDPSVAARYKKGDF